MDEYVGGIGAHYTTNEPLLTRGLELLAMLKEDLALSGPKTHQLQRVGASPPRAGSWKA
jgi:adenylylsulfate reductase subunit A